MRVKDWLLSGPEDETARERAAVERLVNCFSPSSQELETSLSAFSGLPSTKSVVKRSHARRCILHRHRLRQEQAAGTRKNPVHCTGGQLKPMRAVDMRPGM